MNDMNTTKKLTKTLALTAVSSLALALSACAGNTTEPEDPAVTVDPQSSAPTEEPTSAAPSQTPTATDDATDDATSTPSGDQTTGGALDDLTASAIQAIRAAEAEVGGTAYEIDDIDDDGIWEIDVMVNDRSIEVEVSTDGTVVRVDDDDDMDSDDRAGLESAQIDIAEAIQIAVTEFGGALDEAELDDEGGVWVWEVSLRGHGDVDIDIQTGEIVSR